MLYGIYLRVGADNRNEVGYCRDGEELETDFIVERRESESYVREKIEWWKQYLNIRISEQSLHKQEGETKNE